MLRLIPLLILLLIPTIHAQTVVGTFGVSTTGYVSTSQLITQNVSLTTGATTWGYISSTGTYLPKLSSDAISASTISATSLSVTNLAVPNTPIAATDAANKAYVDTAVAASCSGGTTCTTGLWDRNAAGTNSWRSIAFSSDAGKIFASSTSNIFASLDGGKSWVQRTLPRPNSSYPTNAAQVVSNNDSSRIAFVYSYFDGTWYYMGIYTSINAGATWVLSRNKNSGTSSGRSSALADLAMSADGTKMALAEGYEYSMTNGGAAGYIQISTDGGSTWTQRGSAAEWTAIAMSPDGTKLAASVRNGTIYTSTDGGTTWTQRTGSGSRDWRKIAISADGTKLAATVNGGSIYTSSDSGATWTARAVTLDRVAMSADGTKLVGTANGGYLYNSSDSGVTWTPLTGMGTQQFLDAIISPDGTKIGTVIYSGYIFTTSCQ